MTSKLVITVFALLSVGCITSGAQRSAQEILDRDTSIATLHDKLEQAEGEDIYVMAPATLKLAQNQYEMAFEKARSSDIPNAGSSLAQEGLNTFARAMAYAQRSRDVLRDAYEIRTRALDANANEIYPQRAKEIEQQLIDAAELVEKGRDKSARAKQDEIIKLYSQLELDSLKKGLTLQAILAVKEAADNGAEDYAPKSFKLAADEIALTKRILDVDRTDIQKARHHAGKALYLAEKAKQIALLAKSFSRKDYTHEDIVLWYHENLDKIAGSLDAEIAYDQDNQAITDSLVANISKLKASIEQSLSGSKSREDKILKLQTRISELLKAEEKEKFLAAHDRERFQTIEDLFYEDEATVYRDKNDVIIKAHGFYFPVGKSKIEAQNYPLVKKIVDAIHLFPFAKEIVVTGHTDSTGSDSINLTLSRERAYNLKKLFATIGKIPEERITFHGYGEKRPVASNTTAEGRALNRRIEVIIKNM